MNSAPIKPLISTPDLNKIDVRIGTILAVEDVGAFGDARMSARRFRRPRALHSRRHKKVAAMALRLLSWLENIEGKYRITEVMVRPRVGLKDKAELERAREIMESVEAQCFISNSIKSKVSLAAQFVVAPSPK